MWVKVKPLLLIQDINGICWAFFPPILCYPQRISTLRCLRVFPVPHVFSSVLQLLSFVLRLASRLSFCFSSLSPLSHFISSTVPPTASSSFTLYLFIYSPPLRCLIFRPSPPLSLPFLPVGSCRVGMVTQFGTVGIVGDRVFFTAGRAAAPKQIVKCQVNR